MTADGCDRMRYLHRASISRKFPMHLHGTWIAQVWNTAFAPPLLERVT